ncbi:MAG: WD40 repeat domain-containing serine/threonine protein kinase [Phycisphaerales bacterium]
MSKARKIFLSVQPLDLAAREEAVDRACEGDPAVLDLVRLLLRGADAPLPIEALADELQAAAGSYADPFVTRAGEAGDMGGSRIGNYRLLERLGEGGFGVVFMAEQERPVRRRVAFKIIKLGMDTKQVVARFEAERQALALMDHPNIAKVFDAGATETGRPYFVMELVRGSPITEYCDRKRLTIRERLGLMATVCEALQHAHQKGVIHRDIKPSNVLVSAENGGETAVPKIIDFGIAKATSARLTEKTIFTEFRQMIGTPEYMSPEQAAESSEDVDTRADVYSAGVLLYELLAGSTPFDSRRLRSAAYGEMQRIIREEDPPKPSTKLTASAQSLDAVAAARALPPARLAGIVRGELDWIVMKAIEKDRSRRYDSAGSMARDLHRFLGGEAVQAAPPGQWYAMSKFLRRHKGPVLAALLLALTLFAGLIGTGIGFINADRERTEAVKQSTRADQKAAEALAAEALAQRGAYSANVLSACGAVESNRFAAARAFLDAAPEHLRGWEWHTLRAQLDTSARSLPCPMPEWKPRTEPSVYTLIPHPDGHSFFTTDLFQSPGAQRWDASTGKLLASFPFTDACYAVSPNGSRFSVVVGTFLSPTSDVASWDLATGDRTDFHLPAIDNSRGVIALHPDGRRVLRQSAEEIWIEDAATNRILARARPKDMDGYRAIFSRDGARVAVPGSQGGVRVFDTDTLTPIAFLTGHRNIVSGRDFSPDNRRLATASIDGTAQIYELPAAPSLSSADVPPALVLEHPTTVDNIRFSPDGRLVATIGGDRAIRVWDVSDEGVKRASAQTIGRRSADLLATFASEKLFPGPLMFTPDGTSVAGRETDGTVRFWDLGAADAVTLRGHAGLVNRAEHAPEAGLIVSAGWDGWKGSAGSVRLWEAATGEPIAALGEPGEVAYLLSVSPDGRRAAASITMTDSPFSPKERIGDRHVDIIDLSTGRIVRKDYSKRVRGGDESQLGTAFHPLGEFLAVVRWDSIEILRAETGEVVRSRSSAELRTGHGNAWFSPDGRFLVARRQATTPDASGNLGTTLLLDAGTLEPVRALDATPSQSVAFTPDSRHVCFGSLGGVISVFNVASGERLAEFKAHTDYIGTLSFNADGSRLASVCGVEHDVSIWDCSRFPALERVARFNADGHVSSACWSRGDDGVERLITTPGRTIRIFEPVPIAQRVHARAARREAVAQVEPTVASLFAELGDPAKVADRLRADTTLTPLQRRTALQLVLKRAIGTAKKGPGPEATGRAPTPAASTGRKPASRP